MSYVPEPCPIDPAAIPEYLMRELYRIQASIEQVHNHEGLHVEPSKLVDGMVRYADGTDWDPGSGEGLYGYYNGAWNYLVGIDAAGYWDDYTATLDAAKKGATNPPDWAVFRGNIYEYAFDKTTEQDVFVSFHILHNFKKGSAVYPHVHWSPGVSEDTGVVRWGIEYSLAKGHDQEAFPAATTIYVEQAGPGIAYRHMITEASVEDAISTASLEPDTVIMVRLFRDASHANDTFDADAYGIELDLHYLQDRIGTINKAPDFYD